MFGFRLFGLGKSKCAQCGMELSEEFYEWEGKRFCCKDCKRAYRLGNRKRGGKCH